MMKKSHRKNPKVLTYTCHVLKLGSFGFKVTSKGFLTKEQIFSIETAFQKKIRMLSNDSKNIKSWCLLNTNKTITKLSLESRMGKGKGPIYTQGVFVKPGSIIYELQNVTLQNTVELFSFIKKTVPFTLTLVKVK